MSNFRNYIDNINKQLNESIENYKCIKIIDCYNIDEIGEDSKNIVKNYRKILKITGECEVN